MRFGVVRFPGSCDEVDALRACRRFGEAELLWHGDRDLRGSDAVIVPGGFSYGDDLGSGRIFANQLRHHLADTLAAFRDAGKLILGICNGFQILIKSGLLDSDDSAGPGATLTWNASGRFIDRWVHLQVAGERCVFLKNVVRMYLPIAHAEGQFVGRDETTLDSLEQNGQLVLRYCDPPAACRSAPSSRPRGGLAPPPSNPNGAARNVAGMCDASGRVLGLMPHPERFIDRTHHPQWTRMAPFTEGDGLQLFRNAVQYFS